VVRKLAFGSKIWARNLAKDWIPVPTILHRQLPCLLRHNFSTHDFPAVKPWHGKLFRPKLYTKGLSWHSISWYYPFNWTQINHWTQKKTSKFCIVPNVEMKITVYCESWTIGKV
jgi:hypothetical protein